MSQSVINNCSKQEIDNITRIIIGTLKSGRKDSLIAEKEDYKERKKNEDFLRKYDITENVRKDLLINCLNSKDICDVQLDERSDKLRNMNRMYIYCTDLKIQQENKTQSITTYIKIEVLNTKSNKTVLLISMHDPERKMERIYEKLRG